MKIIIGFAALVSSVLIQANDMILEHKVVMEKLQKCAADHKEFKLNKFFDPEKFNLDSLIDPANRCLPWCLLSEFGVLDAKDNLDMDKAKATFKIPAEEVSKVLECVMLKNVQEGDKCDRYVNLNSCLFEKYMQQ